MSVLQWNSMKHTPPCTNWTNTPLSMKHAWKTAQPTSAFPVWRRQSEQCFLSSRPSKHESKLNFFLHQQVQAHKIEMSPVVICQITSFFLPTYAQCFRYYFKCQAGGWVGRKMKNPIIILTQLSMLYDVKVLTFQKG